MRAPRGTELSCKGWQQEAALRMLMNNLDPEVAEDPDHLVVYGGTGRAARSWEAFDAIVAELRRLENDETLLVQSGKPVGVFRTTTDAPRVLIANANLVPHWATWEHFRELERAGLTMYGQMTAGSWIYIATQGIIQGTYETFAEARAPALRRLARRDGDAHRRPRRHGRRSAAGDHHERRRRARRRGRRGPRSPAPRRRLRRRADRLARRGGRDGRRLARATASAARWRSSAMPPTSCPELVRRGWRPDLVTDQTSAHDPLNGYVPNGFALTDALALRASDPDDYVRRARPRWPSTCAPCSPSRRGGCGHLRLRQQHPRVREEAGVDRTPSTSPASCPAFIRPLFCEGKGPFRVAALSGEVGRHRRHRPRAGRRSSPTTTASSAGCAWPPRRCRSRGSRPGSAGSATATAQGPGLRINELVATGEVGAPIVIGRDHLDAGSVASPNRETEAMRDGSDAIADWPILNALVNTAAGATWVSFHHGGGVGIGYRLHAGMVVVADGTPEAAARLERVLTTDPGMGVLRHADAGYERAIEVADERGVRIPMRTTPDDGWTRWLRPEAWHVVAGHRAGVPGSLGRWILLDAGEPPAMTSSAPHSSPMPRHRSSGSSRSRARSSSCLRPRHGLGAGLSVARADDAAGCS